MMKSLNEFLDSVPRSHWRLGERALPVQFSLGWLGIVAGSIVQTVVCAAAGRSVMVSLALVPVAILGFAIWTLLRRAIQKQEAMVFYECAVAIYLSVVGLLHSLGLPLLPYLDLFTIGVCVVLAFGRVGCFIVGCCYGKVSDIGVVYPHECHPQGPRVRRFPVQALECALWLTLAAGAVGLVLWRPPGVALAVVAVAYAIGRFCLESLRDDPRPRWFGLTESRWFALLTGAMALHFLRGHRPLRLDAQLLAFGVGVAALTVLYLTRSLWLAMPVSLPRGSQLALKTMGREFASLEVGAAPVVCHHGSLRVAASVLPATEGRQLIVSLSQSGQPISRAQAQILFEPLMLGAGVADAGVLGEVALEPGVGPGLHAVVVQLQRLGDPEPISGIREPSETSPKNASMVSFTSTLPYEPQP